MEPTLTELVEEHKFRANTLLDGGDFAGAAAEGSRALEVLPDLAAVSMVRGYALLKPLLARARRQDPTLCQQDFKGAYDAFRLAMVMDPSLAEAAQELQRMGEMLKQLPAWAPQTSVEVEEMEMVEAAPAPAAVPAAVPDAGPEPEPPGYTNSSF